MSRRISSTITALPNRLSESFCAIDYGDARQTRCRVPDPIRLPPLVPIRMSTTPFCYPA